MMKERDAAVTALKREIVKSDKFGRRLAKLDGEKRRLKAKNTEWTEDVSESRNTLASVRNQLDSTIEEKATLRKRMRRTEKDLKTANSEMAGMKAEISIPKGHDVKHAVILDIVEEENQMLKKERETWESQLVSAEEKVKTERARAEKFHELLKNK